MEDGFAADAKAHLLVSFVECICEAVGMESTPHSIVRHANELVQAVEKQTLGYIRDEDEAIAKITKLN